jgi:hypothetical protein
MTQDKAKSLIPLIVGAVIISYMLVEGYIQQKQREETNAYIVAQQKLQLELSACSLWLAGGHATSTAYLSPECGKWVAPPATSTP